uniref:Uncharacterized protein n=1 Tax=Arundo donax TaxID=35708 RepID=A0A0A9DBA4_ARUDO
MLLQLLTLMKNLSVLNYPHPLTIAPGSKIWNSKVKFHLLIWSVTRDQRISLPHNLPVKLMFHFLLKALVISRWKHLPIHRDPAKGFYLCLQRSCSSHIKQNGLSPLILQRHWIL